MMKMGRPAYSDFLTIVLIVALGVCENSYNIRKGFGYEIDLI
jgi:hypothetical protein